MLLTPRPVPGRGRGLVTTRDVAGGQVLLTDTPCLLVVAADAATTTCAACLRSLAAVPPAAARPTACPGCSTAVFCSAECAAGCAGAPCFHTRAACAALAAAAADPAVARLPADAASSVRLLVTLGAITAASTKDGDAGAAACLATLGRLTAPAVASAAAAAALADRANAALAAAGLPAVPLTDATKWLAVEDANAFGVLSADAVGAVRGCGFYGAASLFNHDCLPCAARCDDFDGGGAAAARTALTFRALHAIPAGEEATISYVPLAWPRGDRGPRFAALYGFACGCARCSLDALDGGRDGVAPMRRTTGSTVASARSAMSTATGASGGGGDLPDAPAPPADPGYVAVFLAKYGCGACGGTLVPAGPADDADGVCNVCGAVRTHAQFLAALEEGDADSEWDDEDGMQD